MVQVPPLAPADCIFLDLDGTLLALRDDPLIVHADAALCELLARCASRLDGALAIVSGRPIADLDACFEPLRFPAAGVHGVEHRAADGVTTSLPTETARLRPAARKLATAMEAIPMSYLEDKGASLALHWRRAPAGAAALRGLAQEALAELGPSFRLLEGNCVVEVLPAAANKGDAVRAFLREAPFSGRRPVYIGDDVTDLPGFDAAREAGGYGIAVGSRVAADHHLPDVDAVRCWLAETVND
ncbi:MAG: trehalose-phosphatase [Steroidobacteraceae bacterium]